MTSIITSVISNPIMTSIKKILLTFKHKYDNKNNIEHLQTDVDETKNNISETEQNFESSKTDIEKLQEENT
jgi:peptidoglycan hydrolase CwlO-like protein